MTDPLRPAGGVPPRHEPGPPASLQEAAPVGVPPLASVIAKPKSTGGGISLLLALAGAIAIAGVAFAGGRLTAPAATTTSRLNGQGLQGNGQGLPANGQGFAGRGGAFGGIALAGTVSAISADSITVSLASGATITVPLDARTTYHAATPATAGDVGVGSTVRVTPGARVGSPDGSFRPDASPGAGGPGAVAFGPATDVTVVEP